MPRSRRGSAGLTRSLAAWVVLSHALIQAVSAVVPTARIAFQLHHQETPKFAELLGSPSYAAGWGVPLPEIQNARWKHIHMQSLDALDPEGCRPYTLPSFPAPHGLSANPYKTLVVVDRGNCSFLQKATLAISAGANGVIVRGTKKAVYDSILSANKTNTTTLVSSPVEEKPAFEFDCANGQAFVASTATPEWTTDAPQCRQNPLCASKSCVLTGHHDAEKGGFQVCCLWDTVVLMGVANRSLTANVTVPVVYLSIADGQQLQRTVTKFPQLLIRTFARDAPFLDLSSIFLWAMGVATAVGAAYYSAAYERECFRLRTDPEYAAQQLREQNQNQNQQSAETTHDQETWEIDAKTAVVFIAGAAVFLTVFYYIKVASLIPVLFAISATTTFSQLVLAPLLQLTIPGIASRQLIVPFIHDTLPLAEVLGFLGSAALATVWFVYRRSAWYLQNVFGMSLCFLFLRTVQLPSLKVATILLSLAFCYDVFFVFISPLVFGSSVMEDVATGGPAAYTRSDYPGIDYCERYPHFPACVDPDPMPMLLVLPRVFNWLGGVSMLGLGDIILPGLLLSFALRFDYSPQSLGGNAAYFHSVCVAYGVGLGMANAAVAITQLGQPALMYLVPTCLGAVVVRAKVNGDFKAMWTGFNMKEKAEDDDEAHHKQHDGEPTQRTVVGVMVNDVAHDQAPLLAGSPR
jgi:signal peptide peptidase-like 2B